jgi:hypothetical protein
VPAGVVDDFDDAPSPLLPRLLSAGLDAPDDSDEPPGRSAEPPDDAPPDEADEEVAAADRLSFL